MLGLYLAMIDNEEDKITFEELYYKYKSVMFNIAVSILKDKQLSEDAVHEAFLSVAKNISKISDKNCIQTRNYLIIIVKNSARRIYNKNKNEFEGGEIFETVPDLHSIEIDTENSIRQKELMSMITELDVKYSDVLMFRYFYDMKNREIADALGITLENVKIRLIRGKQMLKEKLLEEKNYDRRTI